MENHNNKNGNNIIIILLLLVIIILGGSCIYLLMGNKEPNNQHQNQAEEPIKQEEQEISLDANNEDVKELYRIWVKEYIERYRNYELLKNINENTKLSIALNNTVSKNIKCKDLNSEKIKDDNNFYYYCGNDISYLIDKYAYNGTNLYENQSFLNELKDYNTTVYYSSDVKNTFFKLFGTKEIKEKKIGTEIGWITYDSKIDGYAEYRCYACGETYGPYLDKNELISATKKGNTLKMVIKASCSLDDLDYLPTSTINYTFEYNNESQSYNFKNLEIVK